MRFRFVSDNNHSGREGWMIDDIVFRGYDVVGNIQKIEKDDILVYYVPSLDYIKIESGKSLTSGFKLTLWDLTGKMISSKKLSGNQFHTGNMEKGLYIYQLYGDELLKTGKIVIK
jgi:hypothetical protein